MLHGALVSSHLRAGPRNRSGSRLSHGPWRTGTNRTVWAPSGSRSLRLKETLLGSGSKRPGGSGGLSPVRSCPSPGEFPGLRARREEGRVGPPRQAGTSKATVGTSKARAGGVGVPLWETGAGSNGPRAVEDVESEIVGFFPPEQL